MSGTRNMVYKYGLRPPVGESRERVMEALYQAHRLYNQSIEVLREGYFRYIALDEGHPDILALAAQKTEGWEKYFGLVERINEMRSSTPEQGKDEHRKKIALLQAEAKEARVQVEAVADKLRGLRKKRDKTPEGAAAVTEINNDQKAKLKVLRQESPLQCTTATAVLDSAKQASADAYGPPQFRRWSGEGTLALQLPYSKSRGFRYQTPEWILTDHPPVTRGDGPNPFVQVSPVSPLAWDRSLTKGQRKYHQRTRLRFRVGRDGRTPIWAEFPMMMHRPFPEGANACFVSISVKKVGNRQVWSVQFTLKVPDKGALPLPDAPKAVGIDWGWRKRPDGYRVAYWADSDGGHGELVLPAKVISKIEHADGIKGIRDKNRDVLRDRLVADLQGKRGTLSEELREEVRSIHQWKSQRRFARLWLKHGDELPLSDRGDDEEFRQDQYLSKYRNYFEAWFHRDRHLWQYEAGARRSAYARRNDIYRNWAAKLASQYDIIVSEDIKVGNLAKKASPENKADLPDEVAAMNNASSRQRSRAAVGILRQMVINAAVKGRKTVVRANARNTSRIHHACGTKVTVGKQMNPTCPTCGVTYDRDQNAALNILARGKEATKTPEALAKANLKPSRKVSRRQAARIAGKKAKTVA